MQIFGCSCCAGEVCAKQIDLGLDSGGFGGIFVPAGGDSLLYVSEDSVFAPPGGPLMVDIPGDSSTTVTLTIGGAINDLLEVVGDRDWFRVNLTAGVSYTFDLGPTGAGDVSDTYLRLRSGAGVLIAENDDISASNLYSRIIFTATTTGVHFLDAGAFSDGFSGNYRITAVSNGVPPTDAIPGDTTSTATITVGGAAVPGVLDFANDHDWYRVNLVAGETYIFRTNVVAGASDPDTTLTLRNAAGTQLVFNDDGGGGTYSQIRYTATTTGTFFIDVGGFDAAALGNYNLTAAIGAPLSVFTNDQIADQLVNGYWGGPANARHFNVAPGGTVTVRITDLTAEGQFLARAALDLWTDATGITFAEVATGGQMVFDDNETGAFAQSTRTGNIITGSTINVGTGWLTTYGTGLNTYSFQTYIHEIGHAIGLGHAGPYNGAATYGSDNSYLNDAWATSVMSYFDQTENTYFGGQGFTEQFVLTPIVADLIATSIMYGTPTATRVGNTTYGYNNTSGRAVYDATQFAGVTVTIVDHGGIDTLDYSGNGQTQTIHLNAEAFSSTGGRTGNVTIARGTLIENAIGGSGNDTIIGNSANNALTGNNGNDYLLGGGGNDTLAGGAGTNTMQGGIGDDTYILANAGDSIIELAGEGTDTIQTALAVVTMASQVELMTYTGGAVSFLGLGNAQDNGITGGTGRDNLYGRDGNDTLNDGGGGVGNEDTLIGGLGDDVYIVGVRGSSTVEAAGEGTDEVRTTFSVYGLQANVENLRATDTAAHDALVGNLLANIIRGSTGADGIYAREGNDTLIGGTGAANTLLGQEGDDTYVVEATGDSVVEFAGQGTDTVTTALSVFTLGTNVENLVYTGSGAFTGIGSSDGNTLTGGLLGDFLSGLDGNDTIIGGSGADTLLGGNGNDQFRYIGADMVDTIVGFTSGQDKIALLASIFTQTGTVQFQQGAGAFANTANSTFLYDSATGIVSYDADGNGAGAAIQLASIGAGLTLAAGDFIFV